MDTLYAIHLFIFLLILTVPFWPIKYLRYGVYIPFILSILWLVCQGCPLTHKQTGLKGNSFTTDLYSKIIPSISVSTADNLNTFTLFLITVIGFHRLKGNLINL